MAQQTLNELYEIIKNRKVQPKEGSYKPLKLSWRAAKGSLARLRIAQKLQIYNVYPIMSSDI